MHASNIYKAEKGLLRINLEVEEGTIKSAQITGDFFLIPETRLKDLERLLVGRKLSKGDIESAVAQFYSSGIITPSVTEQDFVNAILGARYENEATKS